MVEVKGRARESLRKPLTWKKQLLLLVAVLAQALFTLVRRHLMSLSFLTARAHNKNGLISNNYFSLTALTKVLAGLNAGML